MIPTLGAEEVLQTLAGFEAYAAGTLMMLELAGTFVFALSGAAAAAAESRPDLRCGGYGAATRHIDHAFATLRSRDLQQHACPGMGNRRAQVLLVRFGWIETLLIHRCLVAVRSIAPLLEV